MKEHFIIQLHHDNYYERKKEIIYLKENELYKNNNKINYISKQNSNKLLYLPSARRRINKIVSLSAVRNGKLH